MHIVCFDVPYPADYGGVIDVFSRIKSLHGLGVNIHLHCFEYGRIRQPELTKYCVEVNYYNRNTGWKGFSFRLPYIVYSRKNKNLLRTLLKDNHPVLLEGIHCTYFLDELKTKKTFIRLHNVEFEYYNQLAKNETSFLKKLYFKNESRLLKKYETKIAGKASFLSINSKDIVTYKENFNAAKIRYLPAFTPFEPVNIKQGKGEYCLYHGNLSIAENEKVVVWLCENIFKKLNISLLVAGKKPSEYLKNIVSQNKNVSLIDDPSEEKINELISNAQINILPSFNSTGIKIKLLNALFNGRHCVVNKAAIDGTSLGALCHVVETKEASQNLIKKLFDEPFTANEIEKRKQLLGKEFDNETNAELLIEWIY